MQITEFIKFIDSFKKKFNLNLSYRLTPVIHDIASQMASRSPVDSGTFKSQWRVTKRSLRNGVRFRITNPTPYGVYLDSGVEPGAAPWHWPNENNAGTVSKSGKLTVSDSISTGIRVWAGGKSPAGFAIGGIVDPILMNASYDVSNKNQERIIEAVATALMESL